MGVFDTLNIAYSGLQAARAALDVTGQNVSNASTPGYSRQRVDQTDVGGVQSPSLFPSSATVGSGVVVTGISRVTDALANAQVATTTSADGYWSQASSAVSGVEGGLNEPGSSGLSATLTSFWTSWQTMANNASGTSASGSANALIGTAGQLAAQIGQGYSDAANGFMTARTSAQSTVQTINDTAKQVASLNTAILEAQASGGSPNALLDQRDTALTTLANLAGATSRTEPNGTVDVLIGGNQMVSGSSARTLAVSGATTVGDATSNPVQLVWSDSGAPAGVSGGQVAGIVASLQGASADNTGSGGPYAEAATAYDAVAEQLADAVNGAQQGAYNSSGAQITSSTSFFQYDAANPAATLRVTAGSLADIATSSSPTNTNGSNADAISQLGTAAGSPDAIWANFVSGIGSAAKSATAQSTLASSAATSAQSAQTSISGVDLDEETTNLIVYQHAYQAAARVMSTIDDVLNTLINQMGV